MCGNSLFTNDLFTVTAHCLSKVIFGNAMRKHLPNGAVLPTAKCIAAILIGCNL